jgi:cell division inhibitor SepF
MVYLGLADDEEYADYDYDDGDSHGSGLGPAPQHQPQAANQGYQQQAYGQDAPVRMVPRDEMAGGGPNLVAPPPDPAPFHSSAVRTIPAQPSNRLHVMNPASFNEAREIADRVKGKAPVIMNLARTDKDTARRLLDFASGLTYALSGKIRKVADGVFLLTPSGVEVSAEDKRRLRETGMLFPDLDN